MIEHYHAGYDYFTPDNADSCDIVRCRVCNEILTIKKNVNGPRSLVQAIGGGTRLHDVLYCEFATEEWHIQCYALIKEMEKTPSRTICNMLAKERDEIISQRRPTKTVKNLYVV